MNDFMTLMSESAYTRNRQVSEGYRCAMVFVSEWARVIYETCLKEKGYRQILNNNIVHNQ